LYGCASPPPPRCSCPSPPVSLMIGANVLPTALLFPRALATLFNMHASLIEGNAWTHALPDLRACLATSLDALLAVKSQRGELVCQTAAVVGACFEAMGVAAMKAVRGCPGTRWVPQPHPSHPCPAPPPSSRARPLFSSL
jgi:hypothetical protein